ncbi:Putative uncharacterized protein [Weissella confusa LBAE C39-2]|nr:Putative uncharacterized protein [Weissella confusa LBAE C39-2]
MNKTDKLQPLQEMAIAYANSLPGAKAYWRDDWETYYFDIMGKMFSIVHDNVITLKNDPYINTELREQFPFIIPGYHMNKQHWNSIIVDKNEFPDDGVKKLIHDSYDLVVEKMTKKQQAELQLRIDLGQL